MIQLSTATCLNARMTERDRSDGVRGGGVLDVLRVFCGPDGGHGNRLGVVRDGSTMPERADERADRQALAARLGFSETPGTLPRALSSRGHAKART